MKRRRVWVWYFHSCRLMTVSVRPLTTPHALTTKVLGPGWYLTPLRGMCTMWLFLILQSWTWVQKPIMDGAKDTCNNTVIRKSSRILSSLSRMNPTNCHIGLVLGPETSTWAFGRRIFDLYNLWPFVDWPSYSVFVRFWKFSFGNMAIFWC